MTSSAFRQFGKRILHRLAPWTLVVLCLSMAGCANETLRGGSFFEDNWTTMPQSMRHADDQAAPTAYSNKARQIERNFGIE